MFDAQLGPLLVSTNRTLAKSAATPVSTTNTPEWQVPTVDNRGSPIASMSAYERELDRQRAVRVSLAGITVAIATMATIGITATQCRRPSSLEEQTYEAYVATEKELDRTRGAVSRPTYDELWRASLRSRGDLGPGREPCRFASSLQATSSSWIHHTEEHDFVHDRPAYARVGPLWSAVPEHSPRRDNAMAMFEYVSGDLRYRHETRQSPAESLATMQHLLEVARLDYVDTLDLAVEDSFDHVTRAWLFDHQSGRIACVAEIEPPELGGVDLATVISALRDPIRR